MIYSHGAFFSTGSYFMNDKVISRSRLLKFTILIISEALELSVNQFKWVQWRLHCIFVWTVPRVNQSIQSDNHAIGRLSSNASPIYSHLQHWPEFWGIIANHKIFYLNISNSGSWSDNRSTNQWWENVCWEVWTGKSTFDKLKQKLNKCSG